MLYAKYNTVNRVWYINRNPDNAGYAGRDKGAIWCQIKRNAAYARDMALYGKVLISFWDDDGAIKNITLYRSGKKFVTVK